jgi:hypothetical protein
MTDAMSSAGSSAGADRACGHGRDRLVDELRAVALLALDRLDPLLARLRDAVQAPDDAAPCPLCAALAAVRTDRPDLAGRLTEHATGLATALRDALAETAPSSPPASATPRTTRRVQHIPVDREPVDREAGGPPC